MHGSPCGGRLQETGADTCREARSQLHDGHAAQQAGKPTVRMTMRSNGMLKLSAGMWRVQLLVTACFRHKRQQSSASIDLSIVERKSGELTICSQPL